MGVVESMRGARGERREGVGGGGRWVEGAGREGTAEGDWRSGRAEARAGWGRVGAEYRCGGIAALRGGYRLGDRSAGEQRYGSVGAGLRWKYVAADAAYLLAGESSPLHDTWMLTILFSW